MTIYHFLASKDIDYTSCSINSLLALIEDYFHFVEEEKFFSDQMLIFSENIKENRNNLDAIRLTMKSLDLLSPKNLMNLPHTPDPKLDR